MTPATVQVRVDPNAFQNQNGTTAGPPHDHLRRRRSTFRRTVRLLVNNRNPDQRGTFVNIPGTLPTSWPTRPQPLLRRPQDTDQVLVFDSTTYTQIATLRTSTTPTQMAFTFDRKYLVIGHDNSQLAWVYDLDTLQRRHPIQFPGATIRGPIAESGKIDAGAGAQRDRRRRSGHDRPDRFRRAQRHRTAHASASIRTM